MGNEETTPTSAPVVLGVWPSVAAPSLFTASSFAGGDFGGGATKGNLSEGDGADVSIVSSDEVAGGLVRGVASVTPTSGGSCTFTLAGGKVLTWGSDLEREWGVVRGGNSVFMSTTLSCDTALLTSSTGEGTTLPMSTGGEGTALPTSTGEGEGGRGRDTVLLPTSTGEGRLGWEEGLRTLSSSLSTNEGV